MKILSENRIQLCQGNACCPIVELNGTEVKISDDFGGVIKITESEARQIVEALDFMKNQQH